MKNLLIGATAALALLAAPAMAKDTLKIGMIVTLSGPPGALGNQARDGFKLAMDKLDGKIGGMDTEFILEDDELKADVAQSKAKALVEKEEVDRKRRSRFCCRHDLLEHAGRNLQASH